MKSGCFKMVDNDVSALFKALYWLFIILCCGYGFMFILNIISVPLGYFTKRNDDKHFSHILAKRDNISPTQVVSYGINPDNRLYMSDYSIAVTEFGEHEILDIDEVKHIHIIEDDKEVSKMSVGSLVGRTVTGAVLLGGVGAVVGAVTSNRVSSKRINSMGVELLDNRNSVIAYIELLRVDDGTIEQSYSTTDSQYIKAKRECDMIVRFYRD